MDPLTNKPYGAVPPKLLAMLAHDRHGWCFISIPGSLYYLARHHHHASTPTQPSALHFNLSFRDDEKRSEICTYTRLYTRWLYTGGCPQDLATVHADGSVNFSLETRAAIHVIRNAVLSRPIINGVTIYDPIGQVKSGLARFFAGDHRKNVLDHAQNNWEAILNTEPVEDLDRMWNGVWPDVRTVYKPQKQDVEMIKVGDDQISPDTEQINNVQFEAWVNDIDPQVNVAQSVSRPFQQPFANGMPLVDIWNISAISASFQNPHVVKWRPEIRPETRKYNQGLYRAYANEVALHAHHINLPHLDIPDVLPYSFAPHTPYPTNVEHTTRLERIVILKYRKHVPVPATVVPTPFAATSGRPCAPTETGEQAAIRRERAAQASSALAVQESGQALAWELACWLEERGKDVPNTAMMRQLYVPDDR